ncbi:hypothetical protein G3480_01840 [Thiorhodococcus mannitoliphagus]|uniref:PIN domain-containing protein n=1 Tax=Thiorhodococcus mannitoliphagus TaxID=329406 RepID=A0A6P1DTP3_9GAMM|nr:hypothetical protein [Thiorhodococcus mannitoliphagus]
MSPVVIDTNVLLIANGSHQDVSPQCRAECIMRLQARQQSGVVVIDDAFRILKEYQHKTKPNQPKGVGDVFLKWLLQNAANGKRVHLVAITETAPHEFSEFPDPGLQPQFDAPDRKFAAVANAHPDKPIVWQGADCKWLNWWHQLHAQGVKVEFLCPTDVSRFYAAKFPSQAVPDLPPPS